MNKAKECISVPEFAQQTGFTVIQIYKMIDEGKLKSIHKDKKTMVLI